ncbi:9364_t:CDS:1, partial [Gigaspora margarita]
EDVTVKYKAKFNIAKHLLDPEKSNELGRENNRKFALELLKDAADHGIEEARIQYKKELKNEKQNEKKTSQKYCLIT